MTTSALLTLAKQEEADLLRRLAAVRQLIAAYGGEPTPEASTAQTFPAVTPAHLAAKPDPEASRLPRAAASYRTTAASYFPLTTTRSRTSPRTEQALAVVDGMLDERGNANIPLQELLAAVEAQGIDVGGKKPASTLSAMLSNAGRYVSERGLGWRRKREGESTEARQQNNAGHDGTAEREEPPTAQAASGSNPEAIGDSAPSDLLRFTP